MAVPQPPIVYYPIPAVNKWVGKRQPTIALVNHVAQCSTLQQLINWFQDLNNQQASSNFGIGPDGTIACFVDPINSNDAPFANGILDHYDDTVEALIAKKPGVNPNYWTTSVEWVGMSGFPATPFVPTDAQMHSGAWLAAWLSQQQGWAPTEDTLLGHYEFDSITRPACNGWTRSTWVAYEAAIATFLVAPPPDPTRQQLLALLPQLELNNKQGAVLLAQARQLITALPSALQVLSADFETTNRKGNG